MKDSGLIGFFGVVFGLAIVGGALFVAWLIGREALTLLAYVLIGGLVLIGIIVASALPIRAWRRRDDAPIVEKHYIHDGHKETRIIQGGAEKPVLYQLPAQNQTGLLTSDMLRAAWQAGLLADGRGAAQPEERDVTDLDAGWGGDIGG